MHSTVSTDNLNSVAHKDAYYARAESEQASCHKQQVTTAARGTVSHYDASIVNP